MEHMSNDEKMEQLLKQLFPDIVVPYEYIYQTLQFLEETQVNAQILPTVIRAIHNISIGSGKGRVIIHVQGQLVSVSLTEDNKEINTKSIV
jgi:hypothetical protein